jgi:fatty acid desaturase
VGRGRRRGTETVAAQAARELLDLTEGQHHLVEDLERALAMSRKAAPLELLVRPTVGRLLIDATVDWSIIAVAWLGMWFLPAWTYPLTALVVTSRLHSFGVILHDAVHMSMQKKTFNVRLLEVLTGYPVATTLNAMRYHHIRHHRDSGMATDPYFKAGLERHPTLQLAYTLRGIALIPFWTLRGIYGSLACYLPTLRSSYARAFLQDRTGEDLTNSREVIQCAAEDRWQLLFHLVLVPVVVAWPRLFFYAYFVPALIAGLSAAYRLLMEHAYMSAFDRRLETIVKTTSDHNLRGVGRFFLAPRNIGYHIVHHLHPQVAWYELPRLRRWYRDNFPKEYPQQPRPAWHVLTSAIHASRP